MAISQSETIFTSQESARTILKDQLIAKAIIAGLSLNLKFLLAIPKKQVPLDQAFRIFYY
jgi:hypothetical protein